VISVLCNGIGADEPRLAAAAARGGRVSHEFASFSYHVGRREAAVRQLSARL
jgi:hypothetical protein